MRIDLGEDETPEIGLIALIDCIFFLLMFFMVATTFHVNQGDRPNQVQAMELPKAQATLNASRAAPDPLVIVVDARGRFEVDGSAASLQVLRQRIAEVAATEPERHVRIDGDRRTPFQHIVHVLDLCQLEGLTRIAVRTQN
jgi:biopolymer transport protein ExbD